MEEGDATAARPAPGSLTYGSQSGGSATLERRVYVLHLQSDMVQARSAPLQKASDGRVAGCGFEEFQPGMTEVEEGDAHLFRLDPLAAGSRPADNRGIDGDRRIEILHGDRYVLESCL
jgi:hypothetical protein